MADYGKKITRDNYSVKTIPDSATNIKKFTLLSTVNLLKQKAAARVSIAAGGSTTVAHGLSYKPLFWCFFVDDNGKMAPAYHDQERDGVAYIDSTNLTMSNRGFNTHDFYYYIFYDPV